MTDIHATDQGQPKSFFADLLAFGASEMACKASRLLVVIVLARYLSAEQIGVAAAALSIGEVMKSLTENGIAQRVIAADDSRVGARCQAARHLFWMICMGLMLIQILLGLTLWWQGQPILGMLLVFLALEYAFMPAGLVQAALAMREGKLKSVAALSGGQIVVANMLTIALALIWPSPFALILPRLLTAPIWLVAMRRLRPWLPAPHIKAASYGPFLRFGLPVTGIELVKAARLHADKMVVGALLGPEALGVYFMAFNAGLSLATSFCTALNIVLFPHLSRGERATNPRGRMVWLVVVLVAPVVLAQSLLAPYYVPWLLGPGWAQIEPVVAILCLCAIPLAAWSVTAAQLRIKGQPQHEFMVTLGLTLALILGTYLSAPLGLTSMALTYFTITTVLLTCATLSFQPFFPRHPACNGASRKV